MDGNLQAIYGFPALSLLVLSFCGFSNQVGVMGMSLVLSVCILFALAAWLYQRRLTMDLLPRVLNYAFGVGQLRWLYI